MPAQRMIGETWFTPYPFGIPQRAAWVVHNRCLHYGVEFIIVNVGGYAWHVKVCCPPMSIHSVGGPLVVGARESRVQGEGGQEIDVVVVA